ncbi:transcriptional regulator, BolA protein family [Kushneria avicenniae]|uniref:Transcriptional regulator, BolA protein family n=1 Tax=Kushneria avicenniae TaxID=402385 RepID=A0A1I1HTV3_9GAMM|nr:BolA/IbaG family iron-sulfur metabolism protein [Kushneria avicenniae]SFC27354.1 transcriptional regulator, BolA protein family [Kushneria avicenniae]
MTISSVDSLEGADIAALIEQKLAVFEPQWLSIENESHKHNVPPDSQTHFKVTLISRQFEGMMPVKRHQQVYAALSDELAGPVHALALHLYTPEQWETRGNERPDSPNCRGGGA